jgi:hypothetical protein
MKNKTKNYPELNEFVEMLIEEKGLNDLESGVIDQLKQDLLDRVEDRINAVILSHIPPQKLEYFEKMLDSADEDEIQSFCRRNILDLDQYIAKELVDFKAAYLSA